MPNAIEHCLFQGLPAVRLCASNGATATVTLHGAHVVSWVSPAGVEQLYLSPTSRFEASQAIRGGVPVIFPQFNTRGTLPRHGFARTHAWELVKNVVADDACSATFALPNSALIASLWPHAFGCSLQVSLQEARLTLALTVRNEGDAAFSFQAALHTYFAVGSIQDVVLAGLDGCSFEDSTQTPPALAQHTALEPLAAIDRIYFDAPTSLQLQTTRGTMGLEQTGFGDVVVWNPGSAAALPPDLPADGYQHFVCVEAAQIGKPVTLAPTQVWCGTQTIHAAG
jgi:glucose-6-phosphate 1-epimerase